MNLLNSLQKRSFAPLLQKINQVSAITIGASGVLKQFTTFDIKEELGVTVYHLLLKFVAIYIYCTFARIFQCFIDFGEVPSDWGTAKAVHVFKKRLRTNLLKFRLTPFTSIVSEIF